MHGPEVYDFLDEYVALCKKYSMFINEQSILPLRRKRRPEDPPLEQPEGLVIVDPAHRDVGYSVRVAECRYGCVEYAYYFIEDTIFSRDSE